MRTRTRRRNPRANARANLLSMAPACAASPLPAAVEPDLAHDQRAFAREVLQPREVRGEPFAGLQVDVERQEVDEPEIEILGRRVVHVGDQRPGILGAHRAHDAAQERLDLPAAEPAHDRRRDLVAHGVGEHGRMSRAGAHALAGPPLAAFRIVGVVGTQADQEAESVIRGALQQPAWRRRVDANGVDAALRHHREIALDDRGLREFVPVIAPREGSVSHSPNPELRVAGIQELAGDPRALKQQAGGSRSGGHGFPGES